MKLIKKAIFLGSKEFGLEIFKSLYKVRDEIEWLVLCPDDLKDSRSCLNQFKEFTKLQNINFKLVKTVASVEEAVDQNSPEIMFVVGYYQILPSSIIKKIKEGIWGIHNSLLPKYRGSSPLVWQLINGEKIVGSSLFRLREGMDDGEILNQVSFQNSSTETIKSATEKLQQQWKKSIPAIWRDFIEEKIIPFEQDHTKATFCSKRIEQDGLINWSMNAKYLDRFIRAQTKPYPMAFFVYDNKKVHIVKHDIDHRKVTGSNGQVYESKNSYVTICCGEKTSLKIFEVEVDGINYKAYSILNSTEIKL